ncbi:uncharacterized protein LOC131606354 [Vicia villosa]|uniref:uncharacterized protein LOC131606354 n=1 Tax=Vicia villosa TaxID=3911 RepID=UPI00273BAD63|nr:uncharacterized protein LOC131606354 [Vicia villosa]
MVENQSGLNLLSHFDQERVTIPRKQSASILLRNQEMGEHTAEEKCMQFLIKSLTGLLSMKMHTTIMKNYKLRLRISCLKMRHFRKYLEKKNMDMFGVWELELRHLRLTDLRDWHLLQKVKK